MHQEPSSVNRHGHTIEVLICGQEENLLLSLVLVPAYMIGTYTIGHVSIVSWSFRRAHILAFLLWNVRFASLISLISSPI